MATVHYPFQLAYRSVPGAGLVPAMEVDLFYGKRSTRALGVLDSGSTHTVFSVEFAGVLGIPDVTDGEFFGASTMGGRTEYDLFDLEMALGIGENSSRFPAGVGFFAAQSPRNILGRIAVFSRFEIGFRESMQSIQIRPDD